MVKLANESELSKSANFFHGRIGYFLTFISFASIRGVAEILAGDLPAGWDPMNYYAPWTVAYMNQGVFNHHFLGAPPVVYVLTICMTFLIQNLWLALKILAPILYGIMGLSLFHFARSYLSWDWKKSIFCSLLLMLQPAALRVSWDLFKNQLAISLLFFQLPLIFSASKENRRTTKLAIVLLSFLLVLTHQFVAVAYFFILMSIIFCRKNMVSFKKFLALANLPALILFVFIFGLYSGWASESIIAHPDVGTIRFFKTIHYVDAPTFSIFKDYVALYGSYSNLFMQVITLFFLLYAPLLPLVLFGFWNDEFLTPFLVINVIGAFSPLVSPNFALLDFERWVFMLVYPFSIYSANALFKLTGSFRIRKVST